jgi:hypothetical protein
MVTSNFFEPLTDLHMENAELSTNDSLDKGRPLPSYCHDLWVCDYRWGMDWWKDLLTTWNYTLQITDTHRLASSRVSYVFLFQCYTLQRAVLHNWIYKSCFPLLLSIRKISSYIILHTIANKYTNIYNTVKILKSRNKLLQDTLFLTPLISLRPLLSILNTLLSFTPSPQNIINTDSNFVK